MAEPPAYAEILRAIGLILDSHRAERAQVIAEKDAMAVSWQNSNGSAQRRSYSELKIKELQEAARRMRGDPSIQEVGPRSELLRTLGQELDEQGIEPQGIVEEDAGYRISGTLDRRYVNRLYTVEVLEHLSNTRRILRLVPQSHEPAAPPHVPWWWRLFRR